MPNSFCCEADNGVVTAVYPNGGVAVPHVGLHLSHLSWMSGSPIVIVARLSPEDARAIAASLILSADRVRTEYEEYLVDAESPEPYDE